MRRWSSGLVVVAALMLLMPSLPSLHAASFRGQTLRVQFWGGDDGHAIQKYVVDPFVKETGANVIVEYGNTAGSIAKARAQKDDPQLDVILLDDIGVLTLAHEGVLEKLNLRRMPHASQVDPIYVVGGGYGIGFFNYITTIIYNKTLVTPPPRSWSDLWDPKYKGKILSPKITATQGLLLTVMAARLNGGSLDNLAPAWPKLQALRPSIHSFLENRTEAAELLKSGEALLAVDIPYSYKPFIEQGYPIAMTVNLKEGYFSITGSACLVKGHKGNEDVTYAFIDRALTADAQTGMAHDLWYGPTNPNAKLSPLEAAWMVHSPEQFRHAIQVDRLKLLELRPAIIDEWNKIMTQ
jgi:putative spermidine/putrescine transport system substrate-binding protein